MSATLESLQHGKYRINDRVTHNSRSAVYDAHDNQNNVKVTLKEISAKLDRTLGSNDFSVVNLAFSNQASQLTGLVHPSIAKLYDHFTESGSSFLVYETVNGKTLGSLANDGEEILLADILDWADKILDALVYLHYNMPPIVHRNLQPHSILVTSDNQIKLTDFGISHFEFAGSSSYTDLEISYFPLELLWNNLDPASQKVIAQNYGERSEQILKQPADGRSDLYSLAACLFHLLTGNKPMNAIERSIEIIEGKEDPINIDDIKNHSIPSDIMKVIIKALALKREERFDSAIIMRQALKTAGVKIREDQGYDALHISISPGQKIEAEHEPIEAQLNAAAPVLVEEVSEPLVSRTLEPNSVEENLRIKKEQLLAAADQRRNQLFQATAVTKELKKEEAKHAALEAEAKRQATIKDLIESNKVKMEQKRKETPFNKFKSIESTDLAQVNIPVVEAKQSKVPEDIVPTLDELNSAFDNIFENPHKTEESFAALVQEIKVENEPTDQIIEDSVSNPLETDSQMLLKVDEHSSSRNISVDVSADVSAYSDSSVIPIGSNIHASVDSDNFLIGSDYVSASKNKWLLPSIGASILLLIVITASYVALSGSNETEVGPNSQQMLVEEANVPESVPAVQPEAPIEEQTLTQETPSEIANEMTLTEETVSDSPRQSAQPERVSEQPKRVAQPSQPRQQVPAASTTVASSPPVVKPSVAPKQAAAPKKLTVDDLINDN